MSLAALIVEVDDGRSSDSNLSSALRLCVLAWLKGGQKKSGAANPTKL